MDLAISGGTREKERIIYSKKEKKIPKKNSQKISKFQKTNYKSHDHTTAAKTTEKQKNTTHSAASKQKTE